MDEIAMRYFGKTVAEMKGEAEKDAEKNGTEFDDSFLSDLAYKMTNDNMLDILDEMVDAGKELGLDVTVEKKAEKNFILTIKDKDGNVQLVTPVGKLVDRTGVSDTTENSSAVAAACAGAVVLGITGAGVLVLRLRKNEE